MAREDLITALWLMQECEAATATASVPGYEGDGLYFHDTTKHPDAPIPFGRFTMNRDRDVMMSPHTRAWVEATWIVEVVVEESMETAPDDDPTTLADHFADAVDERLNANGRPRTNADAPDGSTGTIVSCQRTGSIRYTEPRPDEADRIHRGGFYRIRTTSNP